MLEITAEHLARIESLGDNCELGFVLRRLGLEAGRLFRWARSRAEQVCCLIEADFERIFDLDALTPSRLTMVEDARYGIHWHTEMYAHIVEGRLAFVSELPARREIHQREVKKFRYLIEKFRHRLTAGGLLLVIKANEGIAPATMRRLHAALAAQAGGASFTLLEVRPAGASDVVGSAVQQAPGLLTGYVSSLADYNTADQLDFAAWTSLLRHALALAAPPRPSTTARGTSPDDGLIMLNLPATRGEGCLHRPPEDSRGGLGVLLHGNGWCRRVEDCFRLHAPPSAQRAAELCWTGIILAGPSRFAARIHAPVPDSLPVRIDVTLTDAEGTFLLHRHCEVSPTTPAQLLVTLPILASRSVVVRISAQAVLAPAPGERAVVDLSLLCFERTDLNPGACITDPGAARAA